jgi:hypothetical protein
MSDRNTLFGSYARMMQSAEDDSDNGIDLQNASRALPSA